MESGGIIHGDFTLSDIIILPDINGPAKAQLESKSDIPDVSEDALANLRDLNATIIAQNKAIKELRAEAEKWERLYDELYDEIAGKHRCDAETAAECIRRIIQERDEAYAISDKLAIKLAAQRAKYRRPPTAEECIALACDVDERLGDPSRQTDVEYGRIMFDAVMRQLAQKGDDE